MFSADSNPSEAALRESLRSLPVPVPSPDFDDRVLAGLRTPRRRWQAVSWYRVWQPLQPLLLGTSCSLGLTLLLLHLTLDTPQAVPIPTPSALSSLAAAAPAPLPPLDALLDRPNLCAGSLAAWNSPPAAEDVTEDGAAAPEKAPRKPEPRRRAEVYRCLPLVA